MLFAMSRGSVITTLAKALLRFVLYGGAGAVLTLFAGALWLGVRRVPDLKPWHRAVLTEEYTRDDSIRVPDWATWLTLEDRLFAELRRDVYAQVGPRDRGRLSRFTEGSASDGNAYPENGNRSYEMPATPPLCGAVMIHGLSDSPYLLKGLAARLQGRGCWVVGLRLPGHGTAPSALKTVHWRDWAAAVRLAVRHLRTRMGDDGKVYLVGFSTGAALSVEYALARLEGERIPRVDGLVLLSPAIGVDPLAWLAVWQKRLSRLPGLEKLAWLDVAPEYDPYKYNSFPVNAGQQIYELTRAIDERLTRLAVSGPVTGFPRTLIFQSVADATVSPQAVIRVLLSRLAAEGHGLVAFDINRVADAVPLLRPGSANPAERLLHGAPWPFDVTLLTNESDSSRTVVALHRSPLDSAVRREPTELAWPPGIFALSHVAVPVVPDDPIYGARAPRAGRTIFLGRLELLGEQGMLAIPPTALGRLRFDPFFEYLWQRTARFLAQ